MINKTYLLFLSFLLVGIITATANPPPGWPHQFYGNVMVNDEPAPNNMVVAIIGGEYYFTLTSDNGDYGLSPNIFYIDDPENDRAGNMISFYLGGRVINGVYDFLGIPVGTAEFQNNGFTNLDFEAETYCGDGYCIGTETCLQETPTTCQADCGVCTEPPTITINSPEAITYDTTKIPLEVSSDQTIIMWWYSLNNSPFILFQPGTILTAEIGENILVVKGINQFIQPGESSVSFTVNVPYCGDGTCNAGETCSNCVADCGVCGGSSSSSSGGSSSSSSGGGSSSSSSGGGLVTNNTNNTITQLTYEKENNVEENNEQNENNNEEIQQKELEQEKNVFSSITGAAVVIGNKLGVVKSIIAIVFVVGILVAMGLIIRKRMK